MKVRWLAAPILLGVGVYVVISWNSLPKELAPIEDRSNIRVAVRAPETAGFDYTQRALDEVAFWLRDNLPEVSRTYSITALFGGAVNTGVQNIYLKEPAERERTQAQIFQQVARGLSGFSSLRVFPSQPPTIGARFAGQPLQYVLQAPSLEAMLQVLPKFLEAAQKRPELSFIDSDLKVNRNSIGRFAAGRKR